MSEHLSVLELEEVLTGGASEASVSHAKTCGHCARALEQLGADQPLRESAPYERAFKEAAARATSPVRRSRLWAGAVIGAALAAGLATLVLRVPAPPQERLKGAPALIIVGEDDAPAGPAQPGERVSVVLSGVSDVYLGLFAIDERGEVSQVWPAERQSSRLPAGGRLPTSFQVTEGSVELVAVYAARPFDLGDASRRLGSPGAAPGEAFPGEQHLVRTHLAVDRP